YKMGPKGMDVFREKSGGENNRELIEVLEQCQCALNQSGKHPEADQMQQRIARISESISGEPAHVSGGVLQGSATYKAQPYYPPAAKAERLSGAVYIKVLIDETGNVTDAKILCGADLLAAVSLEAARQWRFAPTQLNGVPVKVQGVLTFNFTLQ
ncbi:MAG TPA: energy transducer TonB, partial [Blastocatellia bacterium]|nr:energy transducer TonB [Blastocatellia bacterium]